MVPDEHHHRQGIDWRFDKPIVLREAHRVLILGVHEKDSDSDIRSYFDCFEHEVLQESRAETEALMLAIYRHPGEKHSGKLLGLVATDSPGGDRPEDGGCR